MNQNVATMDSMSALEIYRLRDHAIRTGNPEIIENITTAAKMTFNARVGAEGVDTVPMKFRAVLLEEIMAADPAGITVIIDHVITASEHAENNTAWLCEAILHSYGGRVKVSLHSGILSEVDFNTSHVVLLALKSGFVVLKARGAGGIEGRYLETMAPETVEGVLPLTEGDVGVFGGGTSWVHLHEIMNSAVTKIAVFVNYTDSQLCVTPGQLVDYINIFYPGCTSTIINKNSDQLSALKECDVAFEFTGFTIRVVKAIGYEFKSASAILALSAIVLGLVQLGKKETPEPTHVPIEQVFVKGASHLIVKGKGNTRLPKDTGALYLSMTQKFVDIDPEVILNFNGPEEADIIIALDEEFVIFKHPDTSLIGMYVTL